MIDQNTFRITFLISYACCGRLRAYAVHSAHTYMQNMVTLASLASIRDGIIIIFFTVIIDADSGPLGPERSLHFDALAKNTSFSELALHLAPAASNRVSKVTRTRKERFVRSNFCNFYFCIRDGTYEIIYDN